jgi:hypothetical protein
MRVDPTSLAPRLHLHLLLRLLLLLLLLLRLLLRLPLLMRVLLRMTACPLLSAGGRRSISDCAWKHSGCRRCHLSNRLWMDAFVFRRRQELGESCRLSLARTRSLLLPWDFEDFARISGRRQLYDKCWWVVPQYRTPSSSFACFVLDLSVYGMWHKGALFS